MKKIIVSAILFLAIFVLRAQDCETYFPMQKGAHFEITSFDKKDKKTGRVSHDVTEKTVEGAATIVQVKSTSFDDKVKEISKAEYIVKCENGNFYFDMTFFLNDEQKEAFKGMEVEMDNTYLEFPSDLKDGDKLPDGSLTMRVLNNGVKMMTISINITDRVVNTKEELTTAAGTFTCYKISQNIESKIGFITIKAKSKEWYAKNVGMVKSESYNKNDKYMGKSELTVFTE